MRFQLSMAALLFLLVTPRAGIAQQLIQDGGFETPVVPSVVPEYTRYQTGDQFGPWVVGSGSVDLTATRWQASSGVQSLDLDGTTPGSIYQDIPTVPGSTYTLTYDLAGNTEGGSTTKSLTVLLNDSPTGVVTFNTTGHSDSKMGWTTQFPAPFVATSAVTRVEFASDDGAGGFGPVIDNVSLTGALNIVQDGGFESPVVINTANGHDEFSAGQTFGPWTVKSGTVDLTSTNWDANTGQQSLDLDGITPGDVEQTLTTVQGTRYNISFRLAGNPGGGDPLKVFRVLWNGVTVAGSTFDITGHTPSDMGWETFTISSLLASGTTSVLEFQSLDSANSAFGAAIDDVAVTPVPEPAAILALPAGYLLLRRKRERRNNAAR